MERSLHPFVHRSPFHCAVALNRKRAMFAKRRRSKVNSIFDFVLKRSEAFQEERTSRQSSHQCQKNSC